MSMMSLTVSNVMNYESQAADANVSHSRDAQNNIVFIPRHTQTQRCGLTSFTPLYARAEALRSQSRMLVALPCSLEMAQRFWAARVCAGKRTEKRTGPQTLAHEHTKKTFVCAGDSLGSGIKERCGRRDRRSVERWQDAGEREIQNSRQTKTKRWG